ncbi:MAG TPA: hypothetical protein VIY47_00290 [Ignavibacteriaceae bacterium]
MDGYVISEKDWQLILNDFQKRNLSFFDVESSISLVVGRQWIVWKKSYEECNGLHQRLSLILDILGPESFFHWLMADLGLGPYELNME